MHVEAINLRSIHKKLFIIFNLQSLPITYAQLTKFKNIKISKGISKQDVSALKVNIKGIQGSTCKKNLR